MKYIFWLLAFSFSFGFILGEKNSHAQRPGLLNKDVRGTVG
jgi:hypothetical protein